MDTRIAHKNSSTSLQYRRSRGRSRIQI